MSNLQSKLDKNFKLLQSVIKEKYLEGKLNDDKFNELMNYYHENVIFNEPNYIINMDKWGPGHPLFITGSSGDGKSTLAKKLYKNEKKRCISNIRLVINKTLLPQG